MKKAFLFALAICCAFAAQAVNVSWTSHGAVTQNSHISVNGTAKSFSVALAFNLGSTSSTTNMNAFLSVLGDTLCYSIGYDGNGTQNSCLRVGMDYEGMLPTDANNDANWKTNNKGAYFQANSTNVIGLIFYTDGGNQYIDCYVNGTLLNPGSRWIAPANNSTYQSPYLNATFDEIIIGSDTGMSDIELYTMNGKASAADFASVPEPTALALLALGVAGLALKRKVA